MRICETMPVKGLAWVYHANQLDCDHQIAQLAKTPHCKGYSSWDFYYLP